MLESGKQNPASDIDTTTGATVKNALLDNAGLEKLHNKLGDSPAACVVIDVASVGISNSFLKRETVDAYLNDLVDLLKKNFPGGEVVRWGGDESLLIMPLNEQNSTTDLISRLDKLNGPESPIPALLIKHTNGLEEDLSRTELLSAVKKHQKSILKEFVEKEKDISPSAFRSYCQQDEIHERVASPNVLTLYTGSWEHLGSKLADRRSFRQSSTQTKL